MPMARDRHMLLGHSGGRPGGRSGITRSHHATEAGQPMAPVPRREGLRHSGEIFASSYLDWRADPTRPDDIMTEGCSTSNSEGTRQERTDDWTRDRTVWTST